jgi:hypothetical protein
MKASEPICGGSRAGCAAKAGVPKRKRVEVLERAGRTAFFGGVVSIQKRKEKII